MQRISEPNSAIFSPRRQGVLNWGYFKNFASTISSREPFYRVGLDVTAFDIPLVFSDVFRSYKKALESLLEGLAGTVMVGLAPYITTLVGKTIAMFSSFKELKKDAEHYLKFSMQELRNPDLFNEAHKRIKEEEEEDKNFIATLYERSGNTKKTNHFRKVGEEIKDFCDHFQPTEEKRKLAYKLKKYTIIGESAIEGGWWGGFGLVIRAFRKYVLKEDRFTGTQGYASDAESAQLGESEDLNWFQKTIGVCSIFISPVLNTVLLNKAENEELAQKNKLIKTVRQRFDMTHGVYPTLGLLFTMTTVPKWGGTIIMSQGWFERVERILKLFTVIPSWWMGHRATNGIFAKNADKEFAKKHNISPGVLVEAKYHEPVNENDSFMTKLGKWFPDPAKIHHVMKSTNENKTIQDEAEDLHAKCLYKGFAAHSALVWVINMAVNYITKLRVKHALGQ